MINVELNGKYLTNEKDAIEYIFDMMEMSDLYGTDLDGIYDALADITDETHVWIKNRDMMQNSSFGSKLMWVFEDAAEDNNKLWLDWTHEEETDLD